TNRLTAFLFLLYLVALFWILLFKLGVQFEYMDNRSFTLIPFREYFRYHSKIDVAGTVLNVAAFIPLGIYTGTLFKTWNVGKNLFFFFLVSLVIEGLQYVLAVGAFDSTDIITNTVGGLVGLLVCKAIQNIYKPRIRAQKIINVLAAIGTILLIVFLLLLKLNMLPVRYQ
ncbi:MAG: VanZ family protein, partial [Chitinophagaceae bacterium]